MCYECRILGALAHQSKTPIQKLVQTFSMYDFRPSPSLVKEHLVDIQAEAHLHEILSLFKTVAGIELRVIKVDSDGSCLPYAVSRCLIGKEILYDILRQALHEELQTHEDYYAKLFRQGMNAETWKEHWSGIIEEALPTRGARTGRWLGPGEHLVGMANALARPVLLLDSLEMMKKSDGVSSGLFLPTRLSRQAVLDRHGGTIPSPIIIAWPNAKRNHFVALIRVSLSTEDARTTFLDPKFLPPAPAIAIEKACFAPTGRKDDLGMERNKLRGIEMSLQKPLTGPSEFVQLTDSETKEDIRIQVPPHLQPGDTFKTKFMRPPGKLERAFMKLLLENSSVVRTRALNTLLIVIQNLVDAFLANDFVKVAKVSKLRLDNAMVKSNLLYASGALELLLSLGFRVDKDVLEFQATVNESVIYVRDALRSLCEHSSAIPDVEGQVAAGKEDILFGLKPACFLLPPPANEDVWSYARREYASDGPDTSLKAVTSSRMQEGVWIFGSAFRWDDQRQKITDELVNRLHQDFASVTMPTDVGKVDWDDIVLFNKKLMANKCASCGSEEEWTGPLDGANAELHVQNCEKCATKLTAQGTGAQRILAFMGRVSTEGEIGSTRCAKCDRLLMGREAQCDQCN